MGDQLRFVFRHFPLTQIHPHAEGAAEASEAAAAQGRFWEMHDLLYENQRALDPMHLLGYAEELGLDTQRFVRELEERIYQPRVREDFMSGVRSGVSGTPAFFITGVVMTDRGTSCPCSRLSRARARKLLLKGSGGKPPS
jgi:protein-disulfide isomerase